MINYSKVWTLIFSLMVLAIGASGYSSISFRGNTLGFDDAGLLNCVFGSRGGLTTFEYDNAGNLSSRKDANNAETIYRYDALNRLIAVTNQGIEVAVFDHDDNGNVLLASNDDTAVTFGYDEMNHLTASTQAVNGVTAIVGYDYDLNGNRTDVTYPDGNSVEYVYSANNRLQSVDLSGMGITGSVTFGYDGANRLTNIVYPNGINSIFGHNDNGNVTSIKHGSFIDRTIHRNVLGFKEVELIDAGLKPTAPETARRIKIHNDADQLTSEWVQQGTNEYTIIHDYSGTGCLTSSVSTVSSSSYSYDYDNRIQTANGIEYLYDASGSRLGRVDGIATNYFVVDYTDGLKRPLAETDSSGTVTRFYVWAGMRLLCHIEANGDVFYYHSDELGSTLALTDETGNVTDQFAYMPYGYATHTAYAGSSETPFQWLGGYGVYYDSDTKLYLTLHRAYSCSMKRFIHPDPLGIDGGPNIYMWANMNPLFFVDPYGLEAGIFGSITEGRNAFESYLSRVQYNAGEFVDSALNSFPGFTKYSEWAAGNERWMDNNILGHQQVSKFMDRPEMQLAMILAVGTSYQSFPKTTPNRIYSARELARRADTPFNPNHNFPESFNKTIFSGKKTVISDSYTLYTKPGNLNGTRGVYQIGVKPSASGRTEVITHRFFKPNKN